MLPRIYRKIKKKSCAVAVFLTAYLLCEIHVTVCGCGPTFNVPTRNELICGLSRAAMSKPFWRVLTSLIRAITGRIWKKLTGSLHTVTVIDRRLQTGPPTSPVSIEHLSIQFQTIYQTCLETCAKSVNRNSLMADEWYSLCKISAVNLDANDM